MIGMQNHSPVKDKITSFQPFMKELPPPQGYLERIAPVDGKEWNLSVQTNGDEYYEWTLPDSWGGYSWGQWWFYPSFDGKRASDHTYEGPQSFYDKRNADQPAVSFDEVQEVAYKWLKQIGCPFYESIENDEPGVWLWGDGFDNEDAKISDEALKEWEDYWTKCKHEDWDIKTMEELNGELLLLLKCLNCGKKAGTSAPLKHDDWDAESFSAEEQLKIDEQPYTASLRFETANEVDYLGIAHNTKELKKLET